MPQTLNAERALSFFAPATVETLCKTNPDGRSVGTPNSACASQRARATKGHGWEKLQELCAAKKTKEIRADVDEMKYLQILTAVGNREDAERIAETLVQRRLAGCVQIVGTVSGVYWWKSRIEKAEEWLCLIKSEEALYDEVEEAIKKNHPYETPEIIAVPIVAGSREYFGWLDQELRKARDSS